MKKALAFVSALALIVCCLASCDMLGLGGGAAGVLKKAEEALAGSSYTTIVSTRITTDNEELADALRSVNADTVKVMHDGDDLQIALEVAVGGLDLKTEYIVTDGVLYRNTVANSSGGEAVIKEKAGLDEDGVSALLAEVGAGAGVDADDFESFSQSDEGGKTVITCSKIKSESLDGLTDVLLSGFDTIGATAVMVESSINYIVELYGGQFFKTVFSCYYVVTVDDVSYPVTLEVETFYDYAGTVSVTAPADAAEYDEVDLDDIIK